MLKLKFLPILAGAAALALFAAANDAPAVEMLTLSAPIQGNTVGPQSTSNPCIIAGTQCQQPAFMGFNNFTSSGSISSYDMYSTTPTATVADGTLGTPYTLGQLRQADTLGQSSFEIAIDVNTAGGSGGHMETLTSFEVLTGPAGTPANQLTQFAAFSCSGPSCVANIGNIANNGNGFADFTLNNVNFDSLPDNTEVLFHAVWSNATDGAESYFLISVPSPLIGHGLFVLLAVGGVLFGGKFVEKIKARNLRAAC
jgi:hypothetical protein